MCIRDRPQPVVEPKPDHSRRRWLLPAAFFVIGALITGGIVALLMNIAQRKAESTQPFFQVVQLTETSFDPADWGKNFPAQYESWAKTAEMPASEQATPPAGDPRAFMAKSKLAADPRLVTMWQGDVYKRQGPTGSPSAPGRPGCRRD